MIFRPPTPELPLDMQHLLEAIRSDLYLCPHCGERYFSGAMVVDSVCVQCGTPVVYVPPKHEKEFPWLVAD